MVEKIFYIYSNYVKPVFEMFLKAFLKSISKVKSKLKNYSRVVDMSKFN